MKKLGAILLFTIVSLFLVETVGYAQGRFGKDSALCVTNLSFYRDFYQQNNLAEAAPLWVNAFKYCPPTATENLFIHGKKIMRYRIDNHKGTEAERIALIDSLIALHETRAQYYPKKSKTAKEDKIRDLMFFYGENLSKSKEIYDYIDAYINEFGASSDASFVVNSMIKLSEAFKENQVSADLVMTRFTQYNKILEEITASSNDPTLSDKEEMLQNAFVQSGVANCENLINVFTPRFEENQSDVDMLKTISTLLIREGCTDSELFSKVVTQVYRLNPEASSAYFLYKHFSQQGDTEQALNYLKEATNNASGLDKGTYLYELATAHYKNRSFAAAASAARQVAELNPNYAAKADLLLGNIWASTSCGGTEMDKRARFWVATDYMIKAKQKDPKLAEEADKNIARYRGYFPKIEDAFMYDLSDGKSYTVSCGGMTATTTVRTIK